MVEEYEVEDKDQAKPRGALPDFVADMDLPYQPERYAMDDCAIQRRDGTEDFPFTGQSVWLSPYTPAGLTEAGSGFTSGGEKLADAFVRLRRGLSKVVIAHDLVDPNTGQEYPQWWGDPDALQDVPSNVLFYVWSVAINGEPPDARPKGSRSGSRGTSTRRSTARRSRS